MEGSNALYLDSASVPQAVTGNPDDLFHYQRGDEIKLPSVLVKEGYEVPWAN
jgi:hypothetical protein